MSSSLGGGADLIVKSDCSRNKGIATFRLTEPITEGAGQWSQTVLQRVELVRPQGWELCSRPPFTYHLHCVKGASQNITGLFLTVCSGSSCLQLKCCCSSRPRPRKLLMPQQCHKSFLAVAPALQRPCIFWVDWVYSALSNKVQWYYQSSLFYCSGEHPGTCKIWPPQCPFPVCSLVFLGNLCMYNNFYCR